MATQLADARAAGADLIDDTAAAVAAADRFMTAGRDAVLRKVARDGKLDAALLDREQHSAHGLAWLKVYVAALHAMQGWALRLHEAGLIKNGHNQIIAPGTDWRFFNELKKELKR